jgi:hypothetical protein
MDTSLLPSVAQVIQAALSYVTVTATWFRPEPYKHSKLNAAHGVVIYVPAAQGLSCTAYSGGATFPECCTGLVLTGLFLFMFLLLLLLLPGDQPSH